MARIRVEYTIEEFKTFDIKDFTLTRDEIEGIVDKAIADILPGDEDSSDWYWDGPAPKPKGSAMEPPIDWFVDTRFGRAATNGHCIMFERSPLMLKTRADWIDAPGESIDINAMLDDGFRSFPLHVGYFDTVFKPFKKLDGLKILGAGPKEIAYLVLDGDLIGCLMPQEKASKDCFHNYGRTQFKFY